MMLLNLNEQAIVANEYGISATVSQRWLVFAEGGLSLSVPLVIRY